MSLSKSTRHLITLKRFFLHRTFLKKPHTDLKKQQINFLNAQNTTVYYHMFNTCIIFKLKKKHRRYPNGKSSPTSPLDELIDDVITCYWKEVTWISKSIIITKIYFQAIRRYWRDMHEQSTNQVGDICASQGFSLIFMCYSVFLVTYWSTMQTTYKILRSGNSIQKKLTHACLAIFVAYFFKFYTIKSRGRKIWSFDQMETATRKKMGKAKCYSIIWLLISNYLRETKRGWWLWDIDKKIKPNNC